MQLLCRFLTALCALSILAFNSSKARAQEEYEPWEVMRVYFDKTYIGQVVSDAFTPIAIDELADVLKRLSRQQNRTNETPPRTREAQYVASLLGERLHSERSFWQLDSDTEKAVDGVRIGKLTVVPTRARVTEPDDDVDSRQLVDFDQYTADGELVLSFDPAAPRYTFGFYALGTKSRGEIRFALELPSVTMSQLLIATPRDIELYSAEAAVEPATDSQFDNLDDGLRAVLQSRMDENTRLWNVNNSGLTRFELVARRTPTSTADSASAIGLDSHVVAKSQLIYRLSPSRTEVEADFDVLPGNSDSTFRLQLSSELKILEATVNDSPVEFYSVASLSGVLPAKEDARTFVELAAQPSAITGTTVRIKALCLQQGSQRSLPSITLSSAYCLNGTTEVLADNLVVSQITEKRKSSPASEESTREGIVPTDPSAAADTLQPTASRPTSMPIRWHGSPPELDVSLATQIRRWQLESLSQIRVQNEWLTLTCNARLQHSAPDSNEVALQLPQQWLVDNVSIQGQAGESRFKTQKQRRGDQSQILVSWSDTPEKIDFEIQVKAHMPRQNERLTKLSVFSESQLYVPDAAQVEYLALTPGPHYDIDINESTLKLQVQPTDLPAWLQTLIEPADELWFFERLSPQTGPIKLSPSRGGFNSDIVTVLNVDATDLNYTTMIDARPLAGATTGVSILVPASLDPESIVWSLDDSATVLTQSAIGEAAQGSRLIQLQLSRPLSKPFRITARWQQPKPETNQVRVPILAVSGAIDSSSTLIAPSTLRLRQPPVSVQVQGSVKGPKFLQSDLLGEAPASNVDYRQYNLNSVAAFELEFVAGRAEEIQHILVHRQIARHTVSGSGEVTHDIEWFCQTGTASELAFQLPNGWKVESLIVDNTPRVADIDNGRVTCSLPPESELIVSVRCTSSSPSTLWWQSIDLSEPSIDAAVIANERTLRIPRSITPFRSWLSGAKQGTLLDRILPSKLWSNLCPPFDNSQDRWTEVDLTSDAKSNTGVTNVGTNTLTVARKSSLAALSMAAMLLALAVFRLFVPQSFLWWFVLLFTLAIALVLTPRWSLAPVQVIFLGACCAAVLRVLHPLFQLTLNAGVSDQSRLRSGKASAAGGLLVLLVVQPTSLAQENVPPQMPKTYSVLIPTTETEDGIEVDGTYAYAPKALLEKADR
ncbi:MAG TPA: hypothetical protein DDW52_07760, partial [Planctomycetaceae bacterium]|nr:hypothetical protein [Planctomycetaceae bacterium]